MYCSSTAIVGSCQDWAVSVVHICILIVQQWVVCAGTGLSLYSDSTAND